MNKIQVCCDTCGNLILKPKGEYNRRIRLNKTQFYCNNICSGKNKDNINRIKTNKKSTAHLSEYTYNRLDEFSDFRWYMKVIKNLDRQNKTDGFDIDLVYLKSLWDSQGGICPFTGEKMILRTHSNCRLNLASIYSASVDRINNELGYIKGNIRFISNMANIARNRFTDQDLIEFCKKVANNHQ